MGTSGKKEVLRIESLCFAYGEKAPLYHDFSLRVRQGECVGIVGPSGVGKSTLFELIAGNLKAQRGTIERGRIAWIFQDPYSSFHPTYTIRKQIDEVATAPEDPGVMRSLDLTPELLDRLPHELSGGQLQRCSILRALRMEPELLLCDEPTSALDNIIQLETMKMLMGLLDRVGILLITHDMDLAHWACDRIVDLTEMHSVGEELRRCA